MFSIMDGMEKRVGAGVGVLLLRGDKVLLGKRHSDPEKASSELHGEGTWCIPGGKIDFGETLSGAACREVLEETGIEADPSSLEIVSVSSDVAYDAHFVTIGFVCHNFQGEPRLMEPDEIVEWQWFSLDVLPDPMFFPSLRVIENYLNKRLFTG